MPKFLRPSFGVGSLLSAAIWTISPKELAKAFYYDRLIKMIEPFVHFDILKLGLPYLPAIILTLIGVGLFAETIRQSLPKKLRLVKKDFDVLFTAGENSPYSSLDIQGSRAISIVKVGLQNVGKQHLANCKMYIESISPLPPLVGGLPILLSDSNFTLRNDDPERIVDIAHHWEHVDKFRFNSPHSGFAETLNYIDDKETRKIVIKFVSNEITKCCLFKLQTDHEKHLSLEFLGEP